MAWDDPLIKRPLYNWNSYNVVAPAGKPNVVAPAGKPNVVAPAGKPNVVAPEGKPNVVAPAPRKDAPLKPEYIDQAHERNKQGTTYTEQQVPGLNTTLSKEEVMRNQRLNQINAWRRMLLALGAETDSTYKWVLSNGETVTITQPRLIHYRGESDVAHNLNALNAYESYIRKGGDPDFSAYRDYIMTEKEPNDLYRYYFRRPEPDGDVSYTYSFDPEDEQNRRMWLPYEYDFYDMIYPERRRSYPDL